MSHAVSMRGGLLTAVALIFTALPAVATADPPQEPPPIVLIPPPPPPETRWYGWQGLIADASSLLLIGSVGSGRTIGAGLGAIGYVTAPPIIHLAHGHPVKALASFGMRAAAVAVPVGGGFYLSDQACRHGGDMCFVGGEFFFFYTAVLMIPAALVVDDVVLAREPAPPPMVPDASIAPWAAPARGGFVVGLQGLRF